MIYSIQSIAGIVDGQIVGAVDYLVEHLLTDSRKLIDPGTSIFVALVGEKRDGHQYIPDMARRGVSCFLVSRMPEKYGARTAFIVVDDTLVALQQLAAHHRQRFNYPVIGLTGSNGKTIVKEWLHFLLQEHLRIIRSPRSYNSQLGVPLSLWQMDEEADLAIIEAGISQKGEMHRLEAMICPQIGLFTNIGEAHSEGFSSLEEKIREKLSLFRHSQTLIYCADYTDLQVEAQLFSEKNQLDLLSWSRQGLGIMAVQEQNEGSSTRITISRGGQSFAFCIPFVDAAAVENAISCAILLIHLGWSSLLSERMPLLPSLSMRLEMKRGINSCTLINDSYSTDIRSLKIALDFLQQQRPQMSQTVILSDIPETGKEENALYAELYDLLLHYQVDRLIGIGPAFVRQAHRWGGGVSSFWVSTDAFLKVFSIATFKEERILIKGARRFGFERINRILEERRHLTQLTVNLSALRHNLTEYRNRLQPDTKIMAMVKAFSYGSGSVEIANLLQYHQVDYLAVAYTDEGVTLRQSGISLPIMILNPDIHSFDQLVDHDLQPELYSFDVLNAFAKYLETEGIQEFPIHIKVDTGMHRLGFTPEEIEALAELVKKLGYFRVMSVFTHLAGSESASEDEYTHRQQQQFDSACLNLQQVLGYTFIRHLSNTAAILRHPHLQYDMVRLGIGLYGVDTSGAGLPLREAGVLTTTIAQIKKVKAGETVGYNRRGILRRDSIIATIRIGYADGYPRRLGNGAGNVWIRGGLYPIIGSVCMDMTMVDITDGPDITLQDEVVLFGKELPVSVLAGWAGTIPYDIMTGISPRVSRVYIED